MAVAMATLDRFRPSVGAFAIGMARAALDLAVAHAREREAFGRTLSDFQAVSHRLADLTARVHAARLLVHQAAAAYDGGIRPVTQIAAMAKLLATETAQEAVDAAVQVHGARALEAGHPLAHLYAEVRAPRIYEGRLGGPARDHRPRAVPGLTRRAARAAGRGAVAPRPDRSLPPSAAGTRSRDPSRDSVSRRR